MKLTVAIRKSVGVFTLDVDFSAASDRLGIFGTSGSGKSTLVNLLAGTMTPDAGSIFLDDDCLFRSENHINRPPEQRRIAVVFQDPHLFPHMSVRENLLYGYKRCAFENRRIDLESLVQILQLEGLLERGVNNLSGGEQQRVAIGRAILSNPRLLLLDEPLSALHDELKYQIIPYLNSVCDAFGIPFVFISHSLVEMRLMADRVLVMEQGKVADQVTPEQLARNRMGVSQVGYINLLKLKNPRKVGGLNAFGWGGGELLISAGKSSQVSLFELSSRDIILFKKHPEAISARNLLKCRVAGLFEAGNRYGVELVCGGERMIAEVVRQAVDDLAIREGSEIYAAVKASAFRELG